MSLGVPHRHFSRCDSTNARTRELAAAGAPNGTVVTADEQTEGQGRQGRAWVAPRGRALLYSLLLRPLGKRPLLPLATALAVCETAEGLAPGIACKVKWPNDIQLEGRKLAGILIEARPQDDWAVIGVGLNLTITPEEFPPELRDIATSLNSGASADAARASLDINLTHWIEENADSILVAWEARDALRGREVAWDGGSGVAGGVDGRGNLIVATSSGGTVTLNAGEVHLSA